MLSWVSSGNCLVGIISVDLNVLCWVRSGSCLVYRPHCRGSQCAVSGLLCMPHWLPCEWNRYWVVQMLYIYIVNGVESVDALPPSREWHFHSRTIHNRSSRSSTATPPTPPTVIPAMTAVEREDPGGGGEGEEDSGGRERGEEVEVEEMEWGGVGGVGEGAGREKLGV